MQAAARSRTTWTAADLVGGVLCLDFVNTAYGRWRDGIAERIFDYHDLLAWSVHAGALDGAAARALGLAARRRPPAARRVVRAALDFREAMHRLLACLAVGKVPHECDVALAHRRIRRAEANAILAIDASGVSWRWRNAPGALDRMLWPVARSLAELLAGEAFGRLRCCAGPDCSWLFIDASKNRVRRWCSMATCGNRAKAERHYMGAKKRRRRPPLA